MRNTLWQSANELVVKNNIIFGPIHSRRFGISLGIDLSPALKQCNFDCLYCELAPALTMDKQTHTITIDVIIKELQLHLNSNIDVITLTANGEPTLYPQISELIDAIDTVKGKTETLILTNSATLIDKNVYKALLKLDQVKLSLDAISPDIFKKIDRPHESIKVEDVVECVIAFSKEYKGKLFIEILFVHELNDTKEEIQKLGDVLIKVNALRIDIGTIDRPPAYPVVGVSYKELHLIAMAFDATLPIHIASRIHAEPNNAYYSDDEILNTLDKRPLTREDIKLLFDEETQESLQRLIKNDNISMKSVSNVEFLVPSKNLKRKRNK